MAETKQDTETYILFELAGTSYGIRSQDVLHMEMIEKITPVPNAPGFLEGVVFSRGQVIPAVNLRLRFGFPREAHSLRTRLLVVQSAKRAVGLIVDSAREFRAIAKNSIQKADSAVAGTTGKFLSGITHVGDRLVLLLDLETTVKLLESETASVSGEMVAVA